MNVGRLIFREILHRRLNFALGVAAVAAAAGTLTAELSLLAAHDSRTEAVVSAKEAETAEKMRKLEDDYRKITLGMGFNLLILPKGQDLGDLYSEGFAAKTMPEEYAAKLAKSKLLTVNHVMPGLQQKVKWPERERTIVLTGVRGEVFIQSAKQKPLFDMVAPGTMVVGHELHRSLNLKVGDTVALMGKSLKVAKLHPERGNTDDITVWINLAEAQELLNKKGLINSILALECGCAADRIAKIREEIGGILPDTKVIEFASQAVARAETRNRAEAEAKAAVEREKTGRAALRSEREASAAIFVPLALAAGAAWIGFLMLANVRDRRGEIGILRALGLRTRQVLTLFLGKALLMGLVGAGLGIAAGVLAAPALGEAGDGPAISWQALAPILPAAAGLAALAAWVPALLAARQDPAEILREM